MASGFRTKSTPLTWNDKTAFNSTPGATLDFDKFAALEHDTIGIRLASKGVIAVKCRNTEYNTKHDAKHDAKCDTKCARDLISQNLKTWIFAYKPCFLSRP
jgi:hypothetical protein